MLKCKHCGMKTIHEKSMAWHLKRCPKALHARVSELEDNSLESHTRGVHDARNAYAAAWAEGSGTDMQVVEFTSGFVRARAESLTAANATIERLRAALEEICWAYDQHPDATAFATTADWLNNIARRALATDTPEEDEAVEAVFADGTSCNDCTHYRWGPGGPDPAECAVLNGETSEESCPGAELEAEKDSFIADARRESTAAAEALACVSMALKLIKFSRDQISLGGELALDALETIETALRGKATTR